jgi:hypothetical protein
MYTITVSADEAQRSLRRVADGATAAGRLHAKVGSALPYAYGIETGRHRSGRLARRRGGVWYLRNSFNANQRFIAERVSKALIDGPTAVSHAFRTAVGHIESGARDRVVVKTGRLRSSIHAVFT